MPNYDEQYTYTNPDLFQTMTAFPPKRWDVRFISDFDTLGCSEMAGGGLSMEAFLAIKPATGQEGSFRLVLMDPEKIKLRFNMNAVLPSGLFAGMVAEAELNVGEHISIEKNSICSKWQDLAELVQSQDFLILDGLGEDASEEFSTALQSYKEDLKQETGSSDRAGISFRWVIGTLKGDSKLLLMAQVNTHPYTTSATRCCRINTLTRKSFTLQ